MRIARYRIQNGPDRIDTAWLISERSPVRSTRWIRLPSCTTEASARRARKARTRKAANGHRFSSYPPKQHEIKFFLQRWSARGRNPYQNVWESGSRGRKRPAMGGPLAPWLRGDEGPGNRRVGAAVFPDTGTDGAPRQGRPVTRGRPAA